MNRVKTILAMLVALAIAIYIPNVSLAQSDQTGQSPANQGYVAGQQGQAVNPGQTGRPIPQPQGGIATVIGVDQPDNCLRIRSGPGNEYDVVGCAALGEQLNITGVWTSNNWAQLADNGWVYGPQIQTDLRPPVAAYPRVERYTYVEDQYPVVSYVESYLPDYGYETYWYGGVPLFLYSVNVWRKFHPWWLRKHWNWKGSHKAWNQNQWNQKAWNQNPAFRQNFATGTQGAVTGSAATQRGFVRNRPNVSSTAVTPFNANTARSRSPNVVGSGSPNVSAMTFSSPSTARARSFSSPNFSAKTFSSPNISTRSFSSPSFSTRSFSSPSFSARSFSSPARMGSISAKSFSMGRISGIGGGAGIGGVGRRR